VNAINGHFAPVVALFTARNAHQTILASDPETQKPRNPGTRNQEPETRNQEPGTRNPEIQKPRNQEPGTLS
jgi:hypothetical protein